MIMVPMIAYIEHCVHCNDCSYEGVLHYMVSPCITSYYYTVFYSMGTVCHSHCTMLC